jgi:2',3'-cyclic-nucleotide 2'-phosphodiesterase/3'-nucleotidase/5'-nucleotidase
MRKKNLKKLLAFLSAAMISAAAVMPVFVDDAAAETSTEQETQVELKDGEKLITILGTSDMHGNVWGYSYEDNTETEDNGMARLYTYIQQVRGENPNTVLIDAGDDIQGTIMTDDIANKQPDEEHPVIAAMNYMGYDAMTLGNHEFNWGVPVMQKILSQAEFPVLCANIKNPDGSFLTGAGWTIVERGGVKIAVIGVTTPDIQIWDAGKEGIDDLVCESASDAVGEAISEIGDSADVIVVSAHMGLQAEFDEEGGSDSAQKILDDNPEVDVLQVAHYHTAISEMQGDVPVGGVVNGGKEIARFDLTLDQDNNIVSSSVNVVEMEGIEPSEEIRSIECVKKLHEDTIAFIQGGVSSDGEEYQPLGTTTAKFQPENEIAGLPEGKLRDTAVMDLINKVQLEYSGADVSAAALFKDTSDLPEGDINYGNIFDIYKFDNVLYRVKVSGAELKAYMEWSAACYNQWEEGDINISFDPDHPGYLYDMFAGVDYEIDLSQPAGSRIKNVTFKGEPLEDDTELTLAVNNYRYSSGLQANNLISNKKEWESSQSIRDMLVEYIGNHSPISPEVDNNWSITGVDLCEDDPRRQEIIDYINEGLLPCPYNESYNLNDYDDLVAQAKAAAETAEEETSGTAAQ